MKRAILSSFGLVPLCAVLLLPAPAAKAADDNYAKNEAVAKEMIKAMNDLADAFESVKDKNTAKAAAPKINAVCDKMVDIGKKAETLPKLSQAEDEKLKKALEPELKKATERFTKVVPQAVTNSGNDPDFIASLKRLEEVGKALSKLGGK
jgi:hypothetical protein